MVRILSWIKDIAFYIFVLIIILASISLILSKNDTYGSHIFGYKFINIKSESMEPTINLGDLAIVNIANNDVKRGDIITFQTENNQTKTHRVVGIHLKNGNILYETKGDANSVSDQELVATEQIIGSYIFNIPKIGHLLSFMSTSTGIFTFIFFILIIIGVVRFRRSIVPKEQQKTIYNK